MKMLIDPCPFCGSKEVNTVLTTSWKSYVICHNCEAQGPTASYTIETDAIVAKAEAITKWNDLEINVKFKEQNSWYLDQIENCIESFKTALQSKEKE